MKGTIRKIVVAVDNSSFSLTAAHWGAHLAAAGECELVLVHVVDVRYTEGPWFADISGALGAAPYENLVQSLGNAMSERGANILSGAEETANAHGVEARTKLLKGLFMDVIREETEDANLLILGRRGDDFSTGSHFLGTAGERAIRQVQCSCLVVPEHFVEPTRLVVGVNDSGPSRSACAWAEYLREIMDGVRVQPIHVRTPKDETDYTNATVAGEPVQIVDGDAEKILVEECMKQPEQTMCIIGALGHSRTFRELILGTLTFHVLHKTTSPVLIAR